jgi:hypothetical protein
MKTATKILYSLLIFCGGSILMTLIAQSMGNKVSTGGIGPFIIMPMIVAGIAAVWKYNPDKKDDSEEPTLKKD